MQKIEVVAHNPNWKKAFEEESKRIADALGENVVAVHHIGSTSIPTIYAKPIIDFLIEVKNIIEVDSHDSRMKSLGYEVMGEFGIAGRRYFRKDNDRGIRTHQVHVFEAGTVQTLRHLAFRDYLIAHPKDAQKYSELKIKLAREFSQNPDGYMDGKDDFIKKTEQKAARWRESQNDY